MRTNQSHLFNRWMHSLAVSVLLLSSCSLQQRIGKSSASELLQSTELSTAHTGISIYEPAANKYWYNHQPDKYFTPASNTKIVTCYAAMKYLGDSLVTCWYNQQGNDIYLRPAGDPTVLHPDYARQPLVQFLQQHKNATIHLSETAWKDNAMGMGWSWDDYNDDYSAERSLLPVYGNTIKFVQTQTAPAAGSSDTSKETTVYTAPEINWKLRFNQKTEDHFAVHRNQYENEFSVTEGREKYRETFIPFITHGVASAVELLKDTAGVTLAIDNKGDAITTGWKPLFSQPLDSVLAPMMHRSDNFFAEQLLLMVSQHLFGYMNNEKVADTLLKSLYKGFPQKPSWADGSGLSRFNAFSPIDFVWLLSQMKTDIPWSRITRIFSTGNQGTLTNYYTADSGYIYAKTGSLGGVICLSGYLTTLKNHQLVFSVMVNNHQSTGRAVRRRVEKFLQSVRNQY
ncbi:MAG: D-alanyl-D-alanine carboxypeptidase [Bacteroidota bacterium]|nr:D-alanyl-D-alanine carboxypeptidase [Bacteroidota bacterium]